MIYIQKLMEILESKDYGYKPVKHNFVNWIEPFQFFKV
jgi:hypothetical protein